MIQEVDFDKVLENLSDVDEEVKIKIGASTITEEEKNSPVNISLAELSKSDNSMVKVKESPAEAQSKEQFEKT
jgi:hypothetical protein